VPVVVGERGHRERSRGGQLDEAVYHPARRLGQIGAQLVAERGEQLGDGGEGARPVDRRTCGRRRILDRVQLRDLCRSRHRPPSSRLSRYGGEILLSRSVILEYARSVTPLVANRAAALALLGDPIRRALYRLAAEGDLTRDGASAALGIPRSTAA